MNMKKDVEHKAINLYAIHAMMNMSEIGWHDLPEETRQNWRATAEAELFQCAV